MTRLPLRLPFSQTLSWFLKCGPCISVNLIFCKLLEVKILGPPVRSVKLEILGLELNNLFQQAFQVILTPSKVGEHCSRDLKFQAGSVLI